MSVIKLPREIVFDCTFEPLEETKVGSRRWADEVEVVFEYEGKFYKVLTYQATGDSEVDFLDYDQTGNKEIEVTEVKPVEKTIITYEPV